MDFMVSEIYFNKTKKKKLNKIENLLPHWNIPIIMEVLMGRTAPKQ